MSTLALALALTVMLPIASRLAGAEVVRRSARSQLALPLEGGAVSIDYGRPALRGRSAFGGLVPWGAVWRAGDDEATVFATEVSLRIGALSVPPGRYSLFLRPGPTRTVLILNREPEQWGGFNRDPTLDLDSVPLEFSSTATPIELFSIALEPVGARAGRLWLGWENSVWMTTFEVDPASNPIGAPAAPTVTPKVE